MLKKYFFSFWDGVAQSVYCTAKGTDERSSMPGRDQNRVFPQHIGTNFRVHTGVSDLYRGHFLGRQSSVFPLVCDIEHCNARSGEKWTLNVGLGTGTGALCFGTCKPAVFRRRTVCISLVFAF